MSTVPELVDQSLHRENVQIHHRLLNAGQSGEGQNFADPRPPQTAETPDGVHLRATQQGVDRNADSGKVLGDHRRLRSAPDAPL